MDPLQGLLQAQAIQQRYPKADPRRLRLEQQLAQERLGNIMQGWQQNPGRMPGGTGSTGLHRADKFGWSQMLNEQTEAMGINNALAGKPQPSIQYEGPLQGLRSASISKQPMPEGHESFMRRFGR